MAKYSAPFGDNVRITAVPVVELRSEIYAIGKRSWVQRMFGVVFVTEWILLGK